MLEVQLEYIWEKDTIKRYGDYDWNIWSVDLIFQLNAEPKNPIVIRLCSASNCTQQLLWHALEDLGEGQQQ